MSIIRIKKRENPYVQVDSRVLEDRRLSWRSKGILVYLLTKPDGWSVNVKDIWGKGAEGRNAVQACLDELSEYGYAQLVTIKGPGNTFLGKEWQVNEEPKGGFLSVTEKPKTNAPKNRKSGNRALNSNNKDSLTENHSNNQQQQSENEIAAELLVKSTTEFPNVTLVEKVDLEAKKEKDTPSSAAPLEKEVPPPPSQPAEPPVHRYDVFDMDVEAHAMKHDYRCFERYARDLSTSLEVANLIMPKALDEFVFDQHANAATYPNRTEFRKHFWNWLPRRNAAKKAQNAHAPGNPQNSSALPASLRNLIGK